MPKPLCGTVVSTKNTMMVPCMVISERYSSGVIMPPAAAVGQSLANHGTAAFGLTMWKRISSGERHAHEHREQTQEVILDADHLVVQAEDVLSDEALGA